MSGGPLAPGQITDQDYEECAHAQDAVLFAQGIERKFLGKLRVSIERGAHETGSLYYFDATRGIVRRRESSPETIRSNRRRCY
jgi:hypothetical protein